VTELSTDGAVPRWDLPDRMRKALRHSGVGVQEMADYLGVARSSVSNWVNGRVQPSTQTLRLWAMRCGVSYEWLTGGRSPHPAAGGATTGPGLIKPETRAPWALAA
jgi:transcriptional regulator with XRE-family HTH domain